MAVDSWIIYFIKLLFSYNPHFYNSNPQGPAPVNTGFTGFAQKCELEGLHIFSPYE